MKCIMKLMTLLFLFITPISYAQQNSATKIIMDDEIESVIKEIVMPLFNAADISPENINVVIIDDNTLNAAVVSSNTIIIHTKLLLFSEKPDSIAGVMAHEIGHIAAGHLSNKYDDFKQQQLLTLLGNTAGILTSLIGGNQDLGRALSMGGQGLAIQTTLKHSRIYESVADECAMKYLKMTKYGTNGLKLVLSELQKYDAPQMMSHQYLLTHPLSMSRLLNLETSGVIDNSELHKFNKKFSKAITKLKAFKQKPAYILKIYKNDNSDNGLYARSIALYRQSDFNEALVLLDILSEKNNQDPYILELKGEILHNSGQIYKAIKVFKQALVLKPHSHIMRASLANSLLALNTKQSVNEALQQYSAILIEQPNNIYVLGQLAKAYKQNHNLIQAYVTLIKKAQLMNDKKEISKYQTLLQEQLGKIKLKE